MWSMFLDYKFWKHVLDWTIQLDFLEWSIYDNKHLLLLDCVIQKRYDWAIQSYVEGKQNELLRRMWWF